jgi:uracil-DNA glycosylase family 4
MTESIRKHLHDLRNCNLCHGANGINVPALDVPGDGSRIRLMLLGEQPNPKAETSRRNRQKPLGLWEDPALELLRKYVARTGLAREEILYATAVLCLPKDKSRRGKRPSTDEARNCGKHVRGLLDVVRPQLVVTLGHTPLLTLQHTYQGWTELRQYILNYDVGTVLDGRDFAVYPLYFPTDATLKARGERRQMQDWMRIPKILEEKTRTAVQ